MKREYETTFILDARLSPEKIDTKLTDIDKIIKENGGKVSNVNRIGKRRLAYEINKNQYGYYVCYRFAIEGDKVIELRRRYSLEESILRYLTICVPKVVLETEGKDQEKNKGKDQQQDQEEDQELDQEENQEEDQDEDQDEDSVSIE